MAIWTLWSAPAQTDSLQHAASDLNVSGTVVRDTLPYDINGPAKAAFYSAVLPGLGQAYNGQYWKIPVVYLLIGGAAWIYRINQREYLRFRKAYQYRLLGLPDEFERYSTDILVSAQNYYRRNRDLALMGTLLMYALNIIDANVSAHLQQWNIDENLSIGFKPAAAEKPVPGLELRIIF